MDAYADLRAKTLAENHGSPLLAAVALTIGLSANRPDDGPMVRLGWPLDVAVDRAMEVIAEPTLGRDNVKEMALRIAEREGYLLGGQRVGDRIEDSAM